MRKGLCFVLFLIYAIQLSYGNPIQLTIEYGGYNREYLLYTPQTYNPQKPSDLIVCLHGFNSSMNAFFDDYNISRMADSLNMIVLAPQALPEKSQDVIDKAADLNGMGIPISLNAVWGCGLRVRTVNTFPINLDIELNKTVDDVGFIYSMIEKTKGEYNIEARNVFMLGTSMGGFMSYQYAMYHGNDLSGLVSICGSMGTNIRNREEAVKIPVCDFHSVTDAVVPYGGYLEYPVGIFTIKISLCQKKEDVLDFWTAKNETQSVPHVEDVNYYPSSNNITVKKETYSQLTDEVIHYKINGASHEHYFKKENGDCMDYNEEIAKFIATHTKLPTGISRPPVQKLTVYPNPAKDIIHFNIPAGNSWVIVSDLSGRQLLNHSLTQESLDISNLSKGIYLVRILTADEIYQGKLVVE